MLTYLLPFRNEEVQKGRLFEHQQELLPIYHLLLCKAVCFICFIFFVKSSLLAQFQTDRKRRVYDAPKMKSNNGQQPFGKKSVNNDTQRRKIFISLLILHSVP